MSSKRLYNETYNLFMSVLIFLAAAILMQKLLFRHLEPWIGVLYVSPCFLVYFAGRALHRKRLFIALPVGIILSLALSAIPISLSSEISILSVIGYVLIPILTFVLFTMPYITGSNVIGSGRFISGLILFIAGVMISGAHGEHYKAFLNAASIVFMIAGLFTFNRENLRDASKEDRSVSNGRYPPGMRRSNNIMIGAFVGLALILANFNNLRIMITEAVKWLVRMMFALLYWILKLIGGGGGGGDDTGGSPDLGLGGGEAYVPNPLVELIIKVVVILVIIVAALFILYSIVIGIRKLLQNMPDWLKRLLNKLQAESDDAYIDETEDLLGKGGLRKELAKNLADFWDRVTYRAPKFEDMPDNRAKVRFVFKHLLRKLSVNKKYLLSQTPTELAEEANKALRENTDEFMEAYNKARYDSREVPDEAAQLAKKLMKKL